METTSFDHTKLQQRFIQHRKYGSSLECNFVLSQISTIAAFDGDIFAILDMHFCPIFHIKVEAYVAACSLSDNGEWAAFVTAGGPSVDANSVFLVDVFSKNIYKKFDSDVHAKYVNAIYIDTVEEVIHLHCDDLTYQYRFDGQLITNSQFDIKYIQSKTSSSYALTGQAIQMMGALESLYDQHVEQRILDRLNAARADPKRSDYQISLAYRRLGDCYLQLALKEKALSAYKVGVTLNPKLGVKRLISNLSIEIESGQRVEGTTDLGGINMALIQCPECQKEISSTASSCPNCGYVLVPISAPAEQIKKTPLGEKERNIAAGVAMIVGGIIGILISIPLISIIVGIFSLVGSFIVLGAGIGKTSWSQKAKCPYCGTDNVVMLQSESLKCRNCKKISVKKDGYLETVAS